MGQLIDKLKYLKGTRVLVAPLDWGLGHATRCVPVVYELLNCGKEVIIAAYGNSVLLLKERFPNLEYIELQGIEFRYSAGESQMWSTMMQIPKILKATKREHVEIDDIIEKYKIDVVISDNRFGLYSKKCYCIYITHQLMIKAPIGFKIFEPLLWFLHGCYIKKYNECWVPDFATKENLSGDLSHKYPLHSNVSFIGILSRFSGMMLDDKLALPIYDNLVIISGPEPHRTIFEMAAIEASENLDISENHHKYGLSQLMGNTLIIRGLPSIGSSVVEKTDKLHMVGNLPDDVFLYHIKYAKNIICRSGYSTLMDLYEVGRTATLIPTPGQTEQEYLASL